MGATPQRDARPATATQRVARFAAPPVVEVAVAVGFEVIPELRVMALTDLWREKFSNDFPTVEEQAPFQMPLEAFDGAHAIPNLTFELLNKPPTPRLWFLDEPGSGLIQVQSDWFARNWRDLGQGMYPLYDSLRSAFARDFGKLDAFVLEHKLGEVRPIQCEITYINHIRETDLRALLTVLSETQPPSLPRPETINLSMQYVLVSGDSPVGRLYVHANRAVHLPTGEPIIVLNLTARGRPIGSGLEGALAFFDLGAETALNAFLELTRPAMHQAWGIEP